MSTATGIILLAGVIGTLLLAALCRFVTQRRQLSSGRGIGRFAPVRKDGKHIFDRPVTIAAAGKWCRLELRLRARGAYEFDKTWRHFLQRAAILTGTPFVLAVADASGRVLHREEGTLARFLAWLGGTEGVTETWFSERGSNTLEGTVTLLEFVPGYAGSYRILLELQSRAQDAAPGSSSFWEVLEAELMVKEGVIPLSRTARYPHRRVRLPEGR